MNSQERIEKTKQNIIDATSFREPEKIPVGIDLLGFPFAYAGVKFSEVQDDPAKCSEAFCKIFDQLKVDYVGSTFLALPPYKALNALGNYSHGLTEDGTSVVHYQGKSQDCGPEVYDMIIDDYPTFRDDTFPKMRYPKLNLPRQEAYAAMKEAYVEAKKLFDTNALLAEKMADLGIYGLWDEAPEFYFCPFNYPFDYYRGIRGALMDLRRRPEKVKAACDAIWEQDKQLFNYDPEVISQPLPMAYTGFHSECFLNPKQFDEYNWKYFKEGVMPILEGGKKFYILGEGKFIGIMDRFRELPRGSLVILLDNDDPFEAYKKIGDWHTITCGITLDLLQLGTVQQCKDYVKKCFDTFAPGGGFMFYPNKSLVSGTDAKIDNLIAVYELADELSRGKG